MLQKHGDIARLLQWIKKFKDLTHTNGKTLKGLTEIDYTSTLSNFNMN